jgi:hypothetical protein
MEKEHVSAHHLPFVHGNISYVHRIKFMVRARMLFYSMLLKCEVKTQVYWSILDLFRVNKNDMSVPK